MSLNLFPQVEIKSCMDCRQMKAEVRINLLQ